jgi:hypothetical protein
MNTTNGVVEVLVNLKPILFGKKSEMLTLEVAYSIIQSLGR